MKVLVLVDGEHYPPVTRWAISAARAVGHEVLGALLVGGIEKLGAGEIPELGVPLRVSGPSAMSSLAEALDDLRPDAVLDLSDEPILGYRERMELAAVALARGVPYLGSDFRLDPPIAGRSAPGADDRGDRHGQADGEDRDRGRGRADRSADSVRTRSSSPWDAVAPPSHRWPRPVRSAVERLLELMRDGSARGLGLPRGCGHDRRHHRRRPAGGRRARGGAVRLERAAGGRARGRASAPDSSCSRGAAPRSRRSRGTRACWWCRRPSPLSTSADTSVRSGCCYRTWSLLRWLAAQPGSRTFPPSDPTFSGCAMMPGSS